MNFRLTDDECREVSAIFANAVIKGMTADELEKASFYLHDFDMDNEDDAVEFFDNLVDKFEASFQRNYMPIVKSYIDMMIANHIEKSQ